MALPSPRKKAYSHQEIIRPTNDRNQWFPKPPEERLEAIEITPQIIYGYNPATTHIIKVRESPQRETN